LVETVGIEPTREALRGLSGTVPVIPMVELVGVEPTGDLSAGQVPQPLGMSPMTNAGGPERPTGV
jgi:hypothetical protein